VGAPVGKSVNYSASELRSIVRAISGDFVGATLGEHLTEAMQLLGPVIPHTSMVSYLVRPNGPVTPVCSTGLDESGQDDYPRYYIRFDPMAKDFGNVSSTASTLSRSARRSGVDLKRNEYVNDFTLKYGVAHIFGTNMLLDDDLVLTLALHRPSRMPDFEEKDLTSLEIALPPLVRALRVTHAREKTIEALRSRGARANHAETSGVAVLSETFEVQEATGVASMALMDLDHTGELQEITAIATSLKERVRCSPSRSLAETSVIRRIDGRLASIRVSACRSSPTSPLKIILFFDFVHSRLQTMLRLSGQPFGLTERETQVVALLHEGLKQTGIAERLSITLPTVRDHLVEVRRKLGVRTNEQVLGRLLGLL
jgi:DNA-binding CsgD family transcriptional regulator